MLYNPNRDPELQQEMLQEADVCFRYNNTPPIRSWQACRQKR